MPSVENLLPEVCPVCKNLDPNAPLSKRPVILRSPLGVRTQTSSTDFDIKDQFGLGRVALLDRRERDLHESATAGCRFCDLLCRIWAKTRFAGWEVNIFLEEKFNPRITIWDKTNNKLSFELCVSERKSMK